MLMDQAPQGCDQRSRPSAPRSKAINKTCLCCHEVLHATLITEPYLLLLIDERQANANRPKSEVCQQRSKNSKCTLLCKVRTGINACPL